MDKISKHIHSRPRRFNLAPPLIHIGLVEKSAGDIVNHEFGSFNMSLILEGEGFYELKGVKHEVRAPLIILQWPGEEMNYGPHSFWRELYLVYPAESEDHFVEMGLHERGSWSYSLRLGKAFEDSRSRFQKGVLEDLGADQLDLMALELLVVGRGVADGASAQSPNPLVAEGLAWMRKNLDGHFELTDFCRNRQVSPSSYRRLWASSQPLPPHATFLQMKMNKAAQGLTETNLRISEVASSLGFDDPLHFSRRFKVRFGMSPRKYRQRYQPDQI